MQKRHTDRQMYFEELATTTQRFILPYICQYKSIDPRSRVLELGCGDGGNLLPFAEFGCSVIGIDLSEGRIEIARRNFKKRGLNADFRVADICNLPTEELGLFDLIICHDVIEHISQKALVLETISRLLKKDGIAFIAFPAWHMPFGGHKQICRNKILCHFPWLHLLPTSLYEWLLRKGKESDSCINELLSIKRTRTTIEAFEKLVDASLSFSIVGRTLYLINPHYNTKFGLHPIKLPRIVAIPYLGNFMSTTCFYILANKKSNQLYFNPKAYI